jgi:hypothetical protein
MFHRLVAALACFVALVACPASAAAFNSWGPAGDNLEPANPSDLHTLLDKLDRAGSLGVPMPYGRPDAPLPGLQAPRIYTYHGPFAKRFWHKNFGDDAGATGVGADGVPEIAFPPEAFDGGDDGWNPGEAAAAVTHEMGHAAGEGNDDDADDESDAADSQAEHHELYRADLAVFCHYLNWLRSEPGDGWYPELCDLCAKHAATRARAKELRHTGYTEIPLCVACILAGCQ